MRETALIGSTVRTLCVTPDCQRHSAETDTTPRGPRVKGDSDYVINEHYLKLSEPTLASYIYCEHIGALVPV